MDPWRGFLSAAALNDLQIRASRGRWRDVARRCDRTISDWEAVELYKREILNSGGLHTPIRIGVDDNGQVYVGDGHRRAIALMQTGALQFPAHWYRITAGGQPALEDEPFPAHLLDG